MKTRLLRTIRGVAAGVLAVAVVWTWWGATEWGLTFLYWMLALSSMAGVVVSIVNALDARLDIKALNSRGIRNGRRTFAMANLRTQSFRAVELVCLLAIGTASLFNLPTEARRLLYSSLLSVVAVLVIVNSVSDRLMKHRLLHDPQAPNLPDGPDGLEKGTTA